jgi:hypothetical protein
MGIQRVREIVPPIDIANLPDRVWQLESVKKDCSSSSFQHGGEARQNVFLDWVNENLLLPEKFGLAK